jgi:hypothetical protein
MRDLDAVTTTLLKKFLKLSQLLAAADKKRLAKIIAFATHPIKKNFQPDFAQQNQQKGQSRKNQKQQTAVIGSMAEKEQGGSQGESNDKGRRYFFNDVEKGNEPKLMVEFLAIEAEKKQGNKN